MWFNFFQQVQIFQVGNDFFVCYELVVIVVCLWQCFVYYCVFIVVKIEYFGKFQNSGVYVKNVYQWQVVLFVDFIVVKIMGWRDFYVIGVEFYFDIIICDDGNFMVYQWQYDVFVNQIGVVFIFGIDCDCCIVEYGFGVGCSDYYVIFVIGCCCILVEWIVEVLYVVFLIDVFNFKIRDCCVQFGILIDQVFVLINQFFVVQLYKYFFNGVG